MLLSSRELSLVIIISSVYAIYFKYDRVRKVRLHCYVSTIQIVGEGGLSYSCYLFMLFLAPNPGFHSTNCLKGISQKTKDGIRSKIANSCKHRAYRVDN